jgi:hypothetical protein
MQATDNSEMQKGDAGTIAHSVSPGRGDTGRTFELLTCQLIKVLKNEEAELLVNQFSWTKTT